MDTSFTEFAAFLRTLKDERGLTQSDIARALEVAPSQPSGWASGRSRPKPETLERMAEVYGLDLDQLLRLCKYRTRGDATSSADPDEVELLALFRQVPDEHRPTVKSMLRGLTGRRGPRVTKPPKKFGNHIVDAVQQPLTRKRYQSQSVATQISRYGFMPATT